MQFSTQPVRSTAHLLALYRTDARVADALYEMKHA